MIKDREVPEQPYQIHIELDTKCNMKCVMCPIDSIQRGEKMTDKVVINLIHQIKQLNVGYVDFVNYGEPLLHKDFFKYCAMVTHLLGHRKLGIVTNGSMMNENIANWMMTLNPHFVIFSVDAFDKEIYEKVRVGADRDKIYANIEFYIEYLRNCEVLDIFKPRVVMTVGNYNEDEVSKVKEYWSKKDVILHVYRCTGRGGEKAYTCPNNNPCIVILDGMFILSDGRVVPCCEDWNGIEVMGDVHNNTLLEIWKGDKFKSFREKHLSGRKNESVLCRNCKTSMDRISHNIYEGYRDD